MFPIRARTLRAVLPRPVRQAERLVGRAIEVGLEKVLPRSREFGLRRELSFWDDWFYTEGLDWPEDYRARTDRERPVEGTLRKAVDFVDAQELRVLDVGAGPLSMLGTHHETKRVNLVATDVLAHEYARLLAKYGVSTTTPVLAVPAERLVDTFGEASFHVVHARNCIDHAEDPMESVRQMLRVTKPGGVVLLCHREREATREGFRGLHQWDFEEHGGHFLLRSKAVSYDATREVEALSDLETTREGDFVHVWGVRK